MKNINEKIIGEYNQISESPDGGVWTKIENSIDGSALKPRYNKPFRFKRIIITTVICALFITTVLAAAPYIFIQMLGSDNIDFFSLALNNNTNIRYAGDYNLVRQYSSEVGVTAEGKGYSFTVDNIAFDGTFLMVFYTIEKKVDIMEEYTAFVNKWDSLVGTVDENNAVYSNTAIGLKIDGYELPNYGLGFGVTDGYLVSGNEIKAMQRFIITDDLPDIFDIEITHFNMFDDGLMRMVSTAALQDEETLQKKVLDRVYKKGLRLSLTIDRSENRVEQRAFSPDLSMAIAQKKQQGIATTEITEHNITVDRLSISPLGNIIALTEAGTSNENGNYLFYDFYIFDDKGNLYRRNNHSSYRGNPEEDKSFIVEFFGDVPQDAEYIKIVPYNSEMTYIQSEYSYKALYEYAQIDDLPAKVSYSNYGDIIIENTVVTDENFTVTYRTEGMVDDWHLWFHFDFDERVKAGTISGHMPIYNHATDSYTVTYTFENPIENAKDVIKGVGVIQYNVELLEEQAIIIPLR